jgi:nicotinamide mononucleotide transporter
MNWTEVLGFVTGAACVWLTVKQNVWTWPVGIANNVFFIALFWQARLYADMGLQVVYIVLAVLGWYWWLRGGAQRGSLRVSHAGPRSLLALGVVTVAGTAVMTRYLESVNDAAPFLDALTTVGSLAAQYLLTRKQIENWYVWISVDVLYVYLYASRELYLTSGLYAIFLCMCIAGLVEWRRSLARGAEVPLEGAVAAHA